MGYGTWTDPGDATVYLISQEPQPTPTTTPTPIPTHTAPPPTYTTGQILDSQTGKTINGATVQIDGGTLRVFTDAQGRFYIHGASPGWHKLQIWGFAYEFREFDIYVHASGTTEIDTIYLGKISGTVVGRLLDSQTGDPLVAATVQLDGGGQWRTLTDEEGNFMLIFVTPGTHTLQAWGYAYDFQERSIQVNDQGPTDVGELNFDIIPDTVRGQVIDEGTGRPILNAHVQYDSGGPGKETSTNITGRFILINVADGNHQLQVWGWAYGFAQQSFTHTGSTSTDVGVVYLNPEGGTVSGRLVDSVTGLPVYNATAQLDGGQYAPWKTLSAINGDFILYNVSAGSHQFQTWGYAYRYYSANITTTQGGSYSFGDLQLTPDPNTFNGRVLDAQTRLPIEGATIILSNGHDITTTSFPDGRFVLLNVPEGIYRITVEAPGYYLAYFKAAHPGDNMNVEVGDVLLPQIGN